MKKMTILLLLSVFCFLPTKANLHKYYVSITEIHHNKENGQFEFSIKVFFDDLVNAIADEDEYELTEPVEEHKEALGDFIKRHVKLKVGNEDVPLEFLGSEIQVDAVWLYLESVEGYQEFNELTVQNSLFVNLFPSQSNIINFFPQKNTSKGVKGLLLNRRKPNDVIYLNN